MRIREREREREREGHHYRTLIILCERVCFCMCVHVLVETAALFIHARGALFINKQLHNYKSDRLFSVLYICIKERLYGAHIARVKIVE